MTSTVSDAGKSTPRQAVDGDPTHAAPFLIVGDLVRSLGFYRERLGFRADVLTPGDAPFFAVLARGGAMLMLKEVGPAPVPNPRRHPDARWDVFIGTPDPDALAAELAARGVAFHTPLADTEDGLRGFEVADPDGHVLFLGRPHGGA